MIIPIISMIRFATFHRQAVWFHGVFILFMALTPHSHGCCGMPGNLFGKAIKIRFSIFHVFIIYKPSRSGFPPWYMKYHALNMLNTLHTHANALALLSMEMPYG